jgi:hypothetical protein
MMMFLLAASLSCPALNTATARGAVGEDARVTVIQSEKATGYTCEFKAADAELIIEIGTLAAADRFAHFAETACEGGHDIAEVKAIGNEAVACTVQSEERVVGRVRKQSFVIRLSAANGRSLRGKIVGLAEQVAGNLF